MEEDIQDSCPIRGLEDCPRSLDCEGASSKASTSDSEERVTTQWRGFFSILKKGPHVRFQTFPPLKGVSKFTRRKSKRIREDMVPPLNPPPNNSSLDAELSCFKSSWKNFTLSELQVATNNFSQGLSPTSLHNATGLTMRKILFVQRFDVFPCCLFVKRI